VGRDLKILKSKKALKIFCIGLVAGVLVIGLWPLDFSPSNAVWWLESGKSLHFHGKAIGPRYGNGGIVYTPQPLILRSKRVTGSIRSQPSALSSPPNPIRGAFTIELWVRPASESCSGRGRILSFCEDFIHNAINICA